MEKHRLNIKMALMSYYNTRILKNLIQNQIVKICSVMRPSKEIVLTTLNFLKVLVVQASLNVLYHVKMLQSWCLPLSKDQKISTCNLNASDLQMC